MHCMLDTPVTIVYGLGVQRVAAALGVRLTRVQRAARAARLPASWYDALCELAGRDLSRSAFAFKRPRLPKKAMQE
jgi:hypothetical protein